MKIIWLTDVESGRRYFVNLERMSFTDKGDSTYMANGPVILIDQAQMDAVAKAVADIQTPKSCVNCKHLNPDGEGPFQFEDEESGRWFCAVGGRRLCGAVSGRYELWERRQ